jgi:hypothetical protein
MGPADDPSDVGHYRSAYFDFGHWCIFRQSRNPKLAWELAQVLNAEDCQKAYCLHTGMFPVSNALMDIYADDPKMKFFNDFLTEPVHLKYGRASTAWDVKANKSYNTPYATAVEPILMQLESDLCVVMTDPAAALKKAHESCNGVLKALGAH